jgi:hypothetical protein
MACYAEKLNTLRSPLDEMQPGAVLLFHLFDQTNFASKGREFGKFLLRKIFPKIAAPNYLLVAIAATESN